MTCGDHCIGHCLLGGGPCHTDDECIHGFEAELEVEAVEPIDIHCRQYGDDERDAAERPDRLGTWWWILDVYGTSTSARGVLATAESARADAVEYLRELRERIDLTLAELDRKDGG